MASAVANALRGKDSEVVKPTDFMPQFKKRGPQPEKKNLRQKTIDVMSKLVNIQNAKKHKKNG